MACGAALAVADAATRPATAVMSVGKKRMGSAPVQRVAARRRKRWTERTPAKPGRILAQPEVRMHPPVVHGLLTRRR